MPSLHFGWSLWCAVALVTYARSRTVRALGVVHSVITLFAIVITANHYLLDALGGALVFVAGHTTASTFERRSAQPSDNRPSGAAVD